MLKRRKLLEECIRSILLWGGVTLLLFLICFFYYSEKNPNEGVVKRVEESAIEVDKILIERML